MECAPLARQLPLIRLPALVGERELAKRADLTLQLAHETTEAEVSRPARAYRKRSIAIALAPAIAHHRSFWGEMFIDSGRICKTSAHTQPKPSGGTPRRSIFS